MLQNKGFYYYKLPIYIWYFIKISTELFLQRIYIKNTYIIMRR